MTAKTPSGWPAPNALSSRSYARGPSGTTDREFRAVRDGFPVTAGVYVWSTDADVGTEAEWAVIYIGVAKGRWGSRPGSVMSCAGSATLTPVPRGGGSAGTQAIPE